MTKLSVNVNKIATLRNSRGNNVPNLVEVAKDIERYGADGITVHPRPDERHIKYEDVYQLKNYITTELNIEGNPKVKKFVDLVLEVKPKQVTLVPDSDTQLTSDHGWDVESNMIYLQEIISLFKNAGIRTSIFLDPDLRMIELAAKTGTDRVELYTETYASLFSSDKIAAVVPFTNAARLAYKLGLGINAGHDLNLQNLEFFSTHVPNLSEVSIGHALISDALYFGLENTVQMYKRCLNKSL
jgi:pyridoxine 5-phosphate synthase